MAEPYEDLEQQLDGQPVPPEDEDAVVDALVELGLERDAAAAAVADGRVTLALAAQVLEEPELYELGDLAEASGLAPEVLQELFAASGLSQERFTQGDLEASHLFAQLLAVLPLDALLASARARGIALSAIARSDMSVVRDHVVLPLREAGADDLTIAVALAEHAKEFRRVSRRLLLHDYERRLADMISSELSVLAAASDSGAIRACVGFVDLVGYTALAARVDPAGLDDLLDTFETRVVAAAASDDDVSVVKFLGDAAMFVSSDLVTLVDVLLRLTTETEGDEVPLRGGVARGDVLLREGDYFGTAVNVAARLTDIARPWSLLADDSLREELGEHYELRRIRPVHVRGLGHQRPVSVRTRFEVDVEDTVVEPLSVDEDGSAG